MNCAFHSRNTAVVQCQNCGRGLCPACDHRIRGFPYCQDCIVAGIGLLQASPPSIASNNFPASRVSPLLATLLSLVCPGLGAAYLGKTVKALMHFALFAGLFQMAIMTRGTAVFVLGFLGMWLFAAVDTWRTALSNGQSNLSIEDSLSQKLTGKPLSWGAMLVIFGIILFLPIPFGIRLFPLLLIGFGVYLLIEHFRRTKNSEPANTYLRQSNDSYENAQLPSFSTVAEFRQTPVSPSATQTGSARPTTRFGNRP